jgi:hypothetical protein
MEKRRLAAEREYEMKKMEAQLTYERELAEEAERVKYEYWRGQRIPLHLGVVERKVPLQRQHSNEGMGDSVIVIGDKFKSLVKYHRHKFTKMEDQRSNFRNRSIDSNVPPPELDPNRAQLLV